MHLPTPGEAAPCMGTCEMTLNLSVKIFNVTWFFVKLQEFWVVTNRGILGPSGYHDCVQSIRVLGRLVEWTAEGITWEADPRHAGTHQEIVRRDRMISSDTWSQRQAHRHRRGGPDRKRRQLIALVQVRYVRSICPVTDLRYKARKLQQPSNLDEMGLKTLARFFGVRPRLIWLFKWQKRVTRIEAWCDTDHAGCIRTRKSVSGCALVLGNSTVSTYCKGQAVVALSSSEAEH